MFPPVLPVTGNNMNYCVAAFAIVLIISLIQWFVDGRKNYTGPQIDIDALKAGEILGEAPMDGGRNSTGVQSEGLGYSKSKEAEATNGIH
jgi:choline transport protein